MYGCILNQDGELVVHRQMNAGPEPLLKVMALDREELVVAVEGLCTWSWLADLGTSAGLPCVLGHAWSMKAIPGGKAKHDMIDAHTMAGWLRGGLLPQASVDPAAMRATRDRRRRRVPRTRQRAALLTHVQQPNGQDTLPELGQKIASKANRPGVAARFPDPAVPKRVEVALALMDGYDP
jgi:hypothetical protein